MNKVAYSKWLLAITTLIIGLNLRPIIVSIAPIIPSVQAAIGVNNQIIGLLTTLPVAMMGVFALLSPKLQSSVSQKNGILLGLIVIALACSVRLFISTATVLLVTAIIGGVGIAMVQVLMPLYLKKNATVNASIYLGLFTTGIMAGAAIASATVAPLEALYGWNFALAIMAIPTFFAVLLSFATIQYCKSDNSGNVSLPVKSKNAWLLMIFFGIGTGAYTLVLAWLPLNYIQLGWSKPASGTLLSLLTIAEVVAGILVSAFIKQFPDRRIPLLLSLLLIVAGLLLLIYIPLKFPLIIAITLGLGIGALFPLSLIVTLDYAPDSKQAVNILAFVQGGGYLIASAFPFIAGTIVDTASTLVSAWVGMIIGILLLFYIACKFSPKGFSIYP